MSRHRAERVDGWWTGETLGSIEAAGLDPTWVQDLVARVLEEDLGPQGQDITTCATVPPEQERSAFVVARAAGVVAGMPLLPAILTGTAELLELPVPEVRPEIGDGTEVVPGQHLAELHGRTRVLLVAERAMLNLLCRLSGVATHTRAWVQALDGTGVQVLDTRKTTPGLRPLEKYAVRCGGGTNKRMGLFDVAMIKDNHKVAAGSIKAAYDAVQQTYPDVEIQVEVETPQEAEEAVLAGARFLLCDNMSVTLLAETVQHARAVVPEPIELEATGGLTLAQASAYATAGVDYLSVGALTHSSPVLDVGLDMLPPDEG